MQGPQNRTPHFVENSHALCSSASVLALALRKHVDFETPATEYHLDSQPMYLHYPLCPGLWGILKGSLGQVRVLVGLGYLEGILEIGEGDLRLTTWAALQRGRSPNDKSLRHVPRCSPTETQLLLADHEHYLELPDTQRMLARRARCRGLNTHSSLPFSRV